MNEHKFDCTHRSWRRRRRNHITPRRHPLHLCLRSHRWNGLRRHNSKPQRIHPVPSHRACLFETRRSCLALAINTPWWPPHGMVKALPGCVALSYMDITIKTSIQVRLFRMPNFRNKWFSEDQFFNKNIFIMFRALYIRSVNHYSQIKYVEVMFDEFVSLCLLSLSYTLCIVEKRTLKVHHNALYSKFSKTKKTIRNVRHILDVKLMFWNFVQILSQGFFKQHC